MLKSLLRKQLTEFFASVSFDSRGGRQRTKSGKVGYVILLLFVFASLMLSFGSVAMLMCEPLYEAGLTWLYFAIMGLISLMFGIITVAFATNNVLYEAKDNELLLSMPIPVRKILASRLLGLYILGLLYESVVMIPTLVIYYLFVPQTVLSVILSILMFVALSLLTLILSCALGWVIGLINSRLKNKSMVTVVLSLAFIALYYWGYSQAISYLNQIGIYGEAIAGRFMGALYPFYMMGRGAEGRILPALGFSGIVLAIFAVGLLILEKSFIRIVTTNRGQSKPQYKERVSTAKSRKSALLYKEWKRFSGSAVYMLNCGLGVVFMIVMAVAALLQTDSVRDLASQVFTGNEQYIPLLILAAVAITASMVDITAPSVSLEGKEIWIAQSLPVKASDVLEAKVRLHTLIAGIPAVILAGVLSFVLKVDIPVALATVLTAYIFVMLSAQIGLILNLKMPNLKWTNETAPIKQSLSVMIALFGGWIVVLILGAAYFLLRNVMPVRSFIIAVMVILALLSRLAGGWIRNRGARIFEEL